MSPRPATGLSVLGVMEPLAISVVSIAELISGMRTVERREVWRLLASFRVEPATEIIARRAGDMMRRYRRSQHDRTRRHLIAATADVQGLELGNPQRALFPHVRTFATTVCDHGGATAGAVTSTGHQPGGRQFLADHVANQELRSRRQNTKRRNLDPEQLQTFTCHRSSRREEHATY